MLLVDQPEEFFTKHAIQLTDYLNAAITDANPDVRKRAR
jgi:hypothetical protein